MTSLAPYMPIILSVCLESLYTAYYLFLLRSVAPALFCINVSENEAVAV